MKLLLFIAAFVISIHSKAQCYTINENASYDPNSFETGTLISFLNEDRHSQLIPIGFPFCFYGNTYDSLVVSSNGYVSFDTSLAGEYSPGVVLQIPSTIPYVPKNTIMFPWQDLLLGEIRYTTYGVYPNRQFVVSYDSIGYYSSSACDGPDFKYVGQVQLYESDNHIEIHIQNSPACLGWNSGLSTCGVQNANGTMAAVPFGVPPFYFTAWNHLIHPAYNLALQFFPACGLCAGNVGMESNENNYFKAEVFPNPSNGKFTITTNFNKTAQVEIQNTLGEKLNSLNITQQNTEIDLSDEANGIYFISFIIGNKVVDIHKLIIHH